MLLRLVLYLPVHGVRADRYEEHARSWSLAWGDRIVEVTDDPRRVRELIEAGEADVVAVVARRHRADLAGLPVVEIPHPRPGEALAGAGLLGLGVWLADRWWEQDVAVAAVSVVAAGAAGLAVTVAGADQLGATERAAPPPASPAPVERLDAPVPVPRPALSWAPPARPAPTTAEPEPVEPWLSAAPVDLPHTPAPTPTLDGTTGMPAVTPSPTSLPSPTPSAATPDRQCAVDLEVIGVDLRVCLR